jgi:hypothetical protein
MANRRLNQEPGVCHSSTMSAKAPYRLDRFARHLRQHLLELLRFYPRPSGRYFIHVQSTSRLNARAHSGSMSRLHLVTFIYSR